MKLGAWRVLLTFIFTVTYATWCICGLTHILVFPELYNNLPEVGEGHVDKLLVANVPDICIGYKFSMFGQKVKERYLY